MRCSLNMDRDVSPPLQKAAPFQAEKECLQDPQQVRLLTEIKPWMIHCSSALVRESGLSGFSLLLPARTFRAEHFS